MSIIDIIKRGGDRVKVQGLAQSFLSMVQKKADAEVTFATEKYLAQMLAKHAFCGREPEYVGVVLWIPKDVWDGSKEVQS